MTIGPDPMTNTRFISLVKGIALLPFCKASRPAK
jgi:hypothetical protein